MSVDFVGAGWAFPLAHRRHRRGRAGRPGARDRGGDPADPRHRAAASGRCGPEFGCRIHEHVFAPANAATAGADRLRRAVGAGAVGAADRRASTSLVSFDAADAGTLYIDIALPDPRAQRPAQPGLPVLRDPRRATTPADARRCRPLGDAAAADGEADMVLPAPEPRRPALPGPGRRRQAAGPAALPEWTDHNVSDPGVTLIEAFAQMVDQLIYRLNRVPDRHYVKFLELIGVELRPPAAARGKVTFWLSAPQPQTGAGARARPRWPRRAPTSHDPVVFTTARDLDDRALLVRTRAGAQPAGGAADRPHARRCGRRRVRAASPPSPQPGDALLVGLSNAVPSCAVRAPDGLPGLRASASTRAARRWSGRPGPAPAGRACEVDRDETGGLNKAGDVVLHVPGGPRDVDHRPRAGRLAALPAGAAGGGPADLHRSRRGSCRCPAFTIGGTAPIVHAEVVRDEDARALGRHARPAVRPAAPPGGAVGRAGACCR